MALDYTLPLQVKAADPNLMLSNASQYADYFTKMKTDGELSRIYKESQGDLNKMLELGQQSSMARWVMPQLQAQRASQEKATLEKQKALADIGKVESETLGNTDKVAQSRFSAMQKAIGHAAMTGDKNAAIYAANAARSAGAITPEQYSESIGVLNSINDPEKIKQYAMSVQQMLSPNPAQYTSPTVDNVIDNQTSRLNNQATVGATLAGQQTQRDIAQAKLTQDSEQFNYKKQQDYFERNKPVAFDYDIQGRKYAIMADGSPKYLRDEQGNYIQGQMKGGTATSQAEERQRIARVGAVLDEIGGKANEEGVRDGGILKQSTNSYAGRGMDYIVRAFGGATQGDIATGKLGTLGGQLVALMPKMSGPQSDKDVAMYKQMAGKLDDPTIPYEVRMAALETIDSLNKKYAQMNNVQQQWQGVPYRSPDGGSTAPSLDPKIMSQMP